MTTRSTRHLPEVLAGAMRMVFEHRVEHACDALDHIALATRCPHPDAGKAMLEDVANAAATDAVCAGERSDAGPGPAGNQLHSAFVIHVRDVIRRSGGSALMSTHSTTVVLSRAMRETATAARAYVRAVGQVCLRFGPSHRPVPHQVGESCSRSPSGSMPRGAPDTCSLTTDDGTVIALC